MTQLDLTPAKVLIFRVTHRNNLPLILENGLVCQTLVLDQQNFTPIGNAGIIDDRRRRRVEADPYGTLSDYVSFYFSPVTPMMLNIVTGRGVPRRDRQELVVLVSSLRILANHGVRFVYTVYASSILIARPSTSRPCLPAMTTCRNWRTCRGRHCAPWTSGAT